MQAQALETLEEQANRLEVQAAGLRTELAKEVDSKSSLRSQLTLTLATLKENGISFSTSGPGAPWLLSAHGGKCDSVAKELEIRSRAKEVRLLEDRVAALENDNQHLKRVVKNLRNKMVAVQSKATAKVEVIRSNGFDLLSY